MGRTLPALWRHGSVPRASTRRSVRLPWLRRRFGRPVRGRHAGGRMLGRFARRRQTKLRGPITPGQPRRQPREPARKPDYRHVSVTAYGASVAAYGTPAAGYLDRRGVWPESRSDELPRPSGGSLHVSRPLKSGAVSPITSRTLTPWPGWRCTSTAPEKASLRVRVSNL